MTTGVGFVVALLSLACCSTSVAGQFSASFWETWGYYIQLASTKPIDWNATIGLQDSGQVQESCYDQSVQLHTDMVTGKSYAIQMLDSSGKFNPTGLFEGQLNDVGSFKGCRDRVKDAPDIPADMKPMYCIVLWGGIPPELTETTGVQVFTQGLCVPNTCNDSDVRLLTGTGKTGRFFLSFSVYSNTKKVFNTYQPPGQLPALHGIRVISTLWIIYGHTDSFASASATINNREKVEFYSEWWAFIRLSMDKSVDTFLLLSALLVSYLFMKQLKKNGGSFTGKDLLLHYLHRYWRLTPVYAFLIMIYACLLDYMGTGPAWKNFGTGCDTYFWPNLLYINNWFGGGLECFGWAWYLGVDMQLYVIAPGLLILLYKMLGQEYFTTVYTVTFTRMGPYMVGLLMGYILFKTDRKVPNTRRTKVLMLLGWVLASSTALLFVVLVDQSPAFVTFDRTMFSYAVAWVVFACSVGYGGIITEFLSWSGWVPLSRLTYTAYLVHPIIMHVYVMSLKALLLYSATNWWFYFIAYSFMAFLCGFVASIMVEFPFFGLEKLIFPQRRGRDRSKASNNVTNDGPGNQDLELGTLGVSCIAANQSNTVRY
uniref:Nose resistant-to-fluoxetine protein N-terminal domain-containing protein n=1 Tax=Branchiostoma floridae TaxID=7739 RepID=C3XYN0_BRAFL|eukprot:XP_002610905.1 hypothetical protein BRAFLDRAFT_91501 [Branchiostoma floridae]